MCFLFLCFRTLTARDDTRGRSQIVRAKKKFELDLWASLDPVVLNRINQSQGGGGGGYFLVRG